MPEKTGTSCSSWKAIPPTNGSAQGSHSRKRAPTTSGPDTNQRPAMVTVSVQEYDIADLRPVFGKDAE
jgi:hypothetical protein